MVDTPSSMPSRRRTIRIPSVIPVDYLFFAESNRPLDPEVRTGFTRDLSEGGLCLRLSSIPPAIAHALDHPTGVNHVEVDIGLPERTLRLLAHVIWTKLVMESGRQIRLVGLEFAGITPDNAEALVGFAKHMASRPRMTRWLVASLVVTLLLGATFFAWFYSRQEEVLVQTQSEYSQAADQLDGLYVEMRWLASEVGTLAEDLRTHVPSTNQAGAAQAPGEAGATPTPDRADTTPTLRPAEDDDVPELRARGPAIKDLEDNIAGLRKILERLRQRADLPAQ